MSLSFVYCFKWHKHFLPRQRHVKIIFLHSLWRLFQAFSPVLCSQSVDAHVRQREIAREIVRTMSCLCNHHSFAARSSILDPNFFHPIFFMINVRSHGKLFGFMLLTFFDCSWSSERIALDESTVMNKKLYHGQFQADYFFIWFWESYCIFERPRARLSAFYIAMWIYWKDSYLLMNFRSLINYHEKWAIPRARGVAFFCAESIGFRF